MVGSFIKSSDKDLVVFHLLPGMSYGLRFLLSLSIIVLGVFLQLYMLDLIPGIVLVFIGNLFLIVKGHHNKIKLAKFDVEANWQQVKFSRLEEVLSLNKKMKKWDVNAFDISNIAGFAVFVVVLGIAYALLITEVKSMQMLAVNVVVLFIPHIVTGVRKIQTKPLLVNKIKLVRFLINQNIDVLKKHTVEYYMMIMGREKKLPSDVKFRVHLNDQPDDFLGLYGQLSMNNVSGQNYPYFYVVLVAKKGFGLKNEFEKIAGIPRPLIKEYTEQEDVEVIVVRQFTTRKSGYHTKPKTMNLLLRYGISLTESIIEKYK
ncbi:MAG: hypothetical protein C0594_07635 [Marinilabiliales bacterium]|nr:MAG: hypothetical protein C0594_07635 [Marinilabiliales bacterium]